jgi:NADPH:quinone reductase-like Zn-dependent oxidoreductase
VIPGHDVFGVVVDLGYGTWCLAPGDAVFGITDWYRDGTAAEYVAVEGEKPGPEAGRPLLHVRILVHRRQRRRCAFRKFHPAWSGPTSASYVDLGW